MLNGLVVVAPNNENDDVGSFFSSVTCEEDCIEPLLSRIYIFFFSCGLLSLLMNMKGFDDELGAPAAAFALFLISQVRLNILKYIMIKNYLKSDLQQKLRIPITALDERRMGRFNSNIDKIFDHISDMKVANLSVVRQVSPQETSPEPKFQILKQEVHPHIIIPMQRVAFIELQKKFQLQQRDRDILIECQYRGKVLKEQRNILRAGFPLSKRQHQPLPKKHQSVDLEQSHHHQYNQEIEELLSSKITDSDDSLHIQLDQNNNHSTKVATYANSSQDHLNLSLVGDKTVNQSTQIQIIPETFHSEGKIVLLKFEAEKQNDQHLPLLSKLPSSLNKKATIFGTEERNKINQHEQSPGPAQYTIRRFGEKTKRRQKQKKPTDDASTPTYKVMKELGQRSFSLLPPVTKEHQSESQQVTKRTSRQRNHSDRFTDKYGYPFYPITNHREKPGPADYETNNYSISKKLEQIKEEQKVRGEIKQWLQKQQSFSKM